MTKKPKFQLLWILAVLLVGCTLDDAGPISEAPTGNVSPCKDYVPYQGFTTGPHFVMPKWIDLELTLNPNNPNEGIAARMSSDWQADSIFRFDLRNRYVRQFIATVENGVGSMDWGPRNWLLVNNGSILVMKINGDSLHQIEPHRNYTFRPMGWAPGGDRFFCTAANKTFVYALDGTFLDSIENFEAHHWFSEDSLLGMIRHYPEVRSTISIHNLQSKETEAQFDLPQSPNPPPTNWIPNFPRHEMQLHPDGDHVSILDGYHLWVASLRTKTARELMYFCYSRSISNIEFQAPTNRLLVEERYATQIGGDVSRLENYLIAMNPYTGLRLETLWEFRP